MEELNLAFERIDLRQEFRRREQSANTSARSRPSRGSEVLVELQLQASRRSSGPVAETRVAVAGWLVGWLVAGKAHGDNNGKRHD